jgi:L-arabinose isomerase
MITSVNQKAKVGIMVCGHREYWPQFPGMKEELLKNAEIFKSYVDTTGVEVFTRFVDTVDDAYSFGVTLKTEDIDILFIYLTTYVASGRYVQGALRASCPIVLVGLQQPIDLSGDVTLQSMTGSGSPCQMPEAYNAFVRCGHPAVDIIFGDLVGDDRVKRRIEEWCRAANAKRALKGAVFGYMGHSYEGMYDMNFDPTTITNTFGAHVKQLEMCELIEYIEKSTPDELQVKLKQIKETFVLLDKSADPTTKDIEFSDLEWAARVSVGLDKLVNNNGISGFAYYYMGENNSIYERAASNLIIGNSLMTTNGIAMAGEGDMKTCLAMYITSALGCGGSFAELCSVDFKADVVIVGHDGPHDIRISDKKPTIRGLSLMHGKKGYGVSVEFSIKHGPMTMASIGSDENGQFRFIIAEGESQAGWVPPVGNTLTRGYFGSDVASFLEDWCKAGACHHQSLAIGHCGNAIEKFGKLMGIKTIRLR